MERKMPQQRALRHVNERHPFLFKPTVVMGSWNTCSHFCTEIILISADIIEGQSVGPIIYQSSYQAWIRSPSFAQHFAGEWKRTPWQGRTIQPQM
jgi:hypothetical protein